VALIPTARADDRPGYRLLRYEEDYSFLREEQHERDFWDPIKSVPFGREAWGYASFGGSLRLRQEYHGHPELGLEDAEVNDFQLLRALLHGDLHLGPHARIFVQLGSAWAFGRDLPLRPIDEDRLSIQQGFGELNFNLGERVGLRLRAGRQEVTFGSSRLVSVRDGPNVRLSFDGLRVSLEHPAVRVDAFGLVGVDVRRGPIDNPPNPDDAFWGSYATVPVLGKRLELDAYYLGIRRPATLQGERATELRHSLGFRVFGEGVGPYDYNVEGIFQTGTFGDRTIKAWTVATDQGLTWRSDPAVLRMGLRANVTSGDMDRADSRLGTFNALFPNPTYFSQLTIMAPANHYDLHPRATLRLFDSATLETGAMWFWRQSVHDDVYTPPGVALTDFSSTAARFVGTQLDAGLTASIARHLELALYASWFIAGRAVRDVGGRDTHFFGSWVTYSF
jgi:hypothetical protein